MANPDHLIARASRVHLVGIGGSGMAAFAALLLKMNKQISGSDLTEGASTRRLREAGATIFVGHRPEHVTGADLIIRSAAIPAENPEVQQAQRLGLPSFKLAEAAGLLMEARQGIAIAGTHGKTTTTALVAWLLECAGLDPLALIGGDALNFEGGAVLGNGPMVIEADEYDRRFLSYWPDVAVVTSIEPDHLDYFSGPDEIQAAFQTFVERLPVDGRLLVCLDDPGASRLSSPAARETYGFGTNADWRIEEYQARSGGGSRFQVALNGRAWLVESPLVGKHNASNAVAALATADFLGVGLRTALAALPGFRGVHRRFETKGRPRGVLVLDDYAHHPTAVAATLRAAREIQPSEDSRIWAVFQPHTANRTAALLEEFARSFAEADRLLVLPIYQPSGREASRGPVTSAHLVDRVRSTGQEQVQLVQTIDGAFNVLAAQVRPGDVVLVMGAGDVTALSDRLVLELSG